jgi:hypothetical protein
MNMQFLNVSTFNNNSNNNNTINMFQNSRIIPQYIRANILNNQSEQIQEPEKKILWGPAIWFLLHTMAEKVKPELFSSIRVELLNNIYSICVNLPCPLCSNHAKEYLDKINFNTIQTKNDLKLLLFHFHNEVNKRKNYGLFSREELDEKYSRANTVNIIHNFMIFFQDKYRSPKLIADDLQRKHIAIKLKEWFSHNLHSFIM